MLTIAEGNLDAKFDPVELGLCGAICELMYDDGGCDAGFFYQFCAFPPL